MLLNHLTLQQLLGLWTLADQVSLLTGISKENCFQILLTIIQEEIDHQS